MSAYKIGQRIGKQWTRGYGKTEEINRVVSLAELGREDASRFWQWLELISDEADRLVHDPDFARGFVHGAYTAWYQRVA
jgi:hypothetical protein